jgi:hypothetical protein
MAVQWQSVLQAKLQSATEPHKAEAEVRAHNVAQAQRRKLDDIARLRPACAAAAQLGRMQARLPVVLAAGNSIHSIQSIHKQDHNYK